MTISILGTTNSIKAEVSGTSLSGSAAAGSGANRLLLVFATFEIGASRSVTSLTYNGVALSFVDSVDPPDSTTTSERIELWVLANPAEGTNTLTATFSGSVNDAALVVVSLQGDDALTVADTDTNAAVDVAGLTASLDFGKTGLAVGVIANEINNFDASWSALESSTIESIGNVGSSNAGFRWAILSRAIGSAGTYGIGASMSPETSNGLRNKVILAAAVVEGGVAAAVTPEPISVPVSLGSPDLSVSGQVVPQGLTVTAQLGSPALTSPGGVLLPDNIDTVSYNTASTELVGNTLYLEGYFDGQGFGWENTNARLTDVAGKTINLVLDTASKYYTGAPPGNGSTGIPWTPIWRDETGGDLGPWTKVTDYSRSTDTIYGTIVCGAGVEDIRVSSKLCVTVGELDAFRTEIYESPYVIEPPSSVAASALPMGVHARLNHGTGPNTVPAGTVDLWAARVGTGAYTGIVVLCEHAQEDIADVSAMQFIRWMLGASSEAADFRSRFSVYVYVHNLSGRKCGRSRYNQDVGTDEDPNRSWEGSASEQTNALKVAIELDAPAASVDLAWLLAYHGLQSSNVTTAPIVVYTTTEFAADQEFHARMQTTVGSHIKKSDTAIAGLSTGTSRKFGHIARGAPLSLTLEHADAITGYPDPAAMFDAFGAGIGEVLISLAEDGYFGAAVTPSAMTVTAQLGSPALVVKTEVTPADVVVAPVLGAPALSVSGSVEPVGLTVSASLGAPTIAAHGALTPQPLSVPAMLGAPTLSSAGAVTPAGLTVAVSLGAPTIAAHGDVDPAGLSVAAVLGAPSLSVSGSVEPAALTVPVALGVPALVAGGTVAPAGLVVVPQLGAPDLDTWSELTPAALSVAVLLGVPVIGVTPVPAVHVLVRRARTLTLTRTGRLMS